MHRHLPTRMLLALCALALCAPALAGAAARQSVHAQLRPVAQPKAATGTFTASGTRGQSVVVSWRLSLSKLSGQAKKATLQTPGPRKIAFILCQPCGVRSHGQLALLGSVWSSIAAGGGVVVVTTKAHPRGELRGVLRSG